MSKVAETPSTVAGKVWAWLGHLSLVWSLLVGVVTLLLWFLSKPGWVIGGVGGSAFTLLILGVAAKVSIRRDEPFLSLGDLRGRPTKRRKSRASERKDGSGLKQRAQTLSKEILVFLADRQRGEPEYPRITIEMFEAEKERTFYRAHGATVRYSQDTLNLYNERYAARVLLIRQDFAEFGVKDERLNRDSEHPVNCHVVERIAITIGALAEKL